MLKSTDFQFNKFCLTEVKYWFLKMSFDLAFKFKKYIYFIRIRVTASLADTSRIPSRTNIFILE